MKFNLYLKKRQPAGARYTLVKAGMPDGQWGLYTDLLTLALSAKDGELLDTVRHGIQTADPEFVAGLAIYLREQKEVSYLSYLLSAELAAAAENDERTIRLAEQVVRHATEIPVWMGYFKAASPRRPGRAIRKLFSALLNQLEEYSFSRYGKELQEEIKETLAELQPRAAGREQKALFSKILRNQVPRRSGWEQEWHVLHQQHYDSLEQRQVTLRDKWKEGISSFRIGYTALLDNLQPMLCTGVSGKVLKLAAEYLGNAAAVTRSGHSPLKMLEAYRGLGKMDQGGAGMLSEALERAVLHSSWSRSAFGKNAVSVIAMDISDSMKQPVRDGGAALRFDIAPMLAMLWKSRGDQVITGFVGNTWKSVELREFPVLSATDELLRHEGEAGYATNAHLILQDLVRKQQVVDKVMVFTDTRLWGYRTFNQAPGTNLEDWWRLYKSQVAPHAKLYLFDLAGYGARPLEVLDNGVILIAGWQDRILDVLAAIDEGSSRFQS